MKTRLTKMTEEEAIGRGLPKGAHTYRGMVGGHYDLGGALQFNILTFVLGLREHHFLLDIGCGSLRAGRLFIPYLKKGHYYGIEPEMWMVEEGMAKELGRGIKTAKKPIFSDNEDFDLTIFSRKFDYLLACSIFTHASVVQIKKCLAEAKQVLKPQGIFAFTFLEGITEWPGDEWCPAPRFYTQEHIGEYIAENGLVGYFIENVRKFEPIEWPEAVTQKWGLAVGPEHETIGDIVERFV